MSDEVTVHVETPGVHLEFRGPAALWTEMLAPAVAPLAAGRFRGPGAHAPPAGPAGPSAAARAASTAVAPVAAPAAAHAPAEPIDFGAAATATPGGSAPLARKLLGGQGPATAPAMPSLRPAPARPAAPPATTGGVPSGTPRGPAPAPAAPAPTIPARLAAAWNPAPLYAALAAAEGRRGEKEAVLAALVSLAVEGKRDATAADILAHLERHGFPTSGLKVKPLLAKFVHRKNLVVPGVLPGTFRATPTGGAHVMRSMKLVRASR